MKKLTDYITLAFLSLALFSCTTQIDKSEALKEASQLIDSSDFKSALGKLDVVIKQYPEFDSAYTERGFVNYCLERYESGIKDCSKAMDLNYSNLDSYVYRAFNYAGLDDYKSAVKDYSHIIKLGPSGNYNLALFERSIIYDYWGQFDNAINDSKEILKTDSSNCEVIASLGVLYHWRKQDYENGLIYLNRVIEQCPEYADGYYKRGDFYANSINPNHDYDKAILDFSKAIELNPKHGRYYLSRGLVFRHMDLINKAMEDIDFSISLNPKNGFAYKNRGLIKEQELNDMKGANQDYKKAKELGVE